MCRTRLSLRVNHFSQRLHWSPGSSMFWCLAYFLCATQRCLLMSLCAAVLNSQSAAAGQFIEGLCVFSCFLAEILAQSSSLGSDISNHVGTHLSLCNFWNTLLQTAQVYIWSAWSSTVSLSTESGNVDGPAVETSIVLPENAGSYSSTPKLLSAVKSPMSCCISVESYWAISCELEDGGLSPDA